MTRARRRVDAKFHVGADSRRETANALRELASTVEAGGTNGISGGVTCGYRYHIDEDLNITTESYLAAAHAQLAAQEAAGNYTLPVTVHEVAGEFEVIGPNGKVWCTCSDRQDAGYVAFAINQMPRTAEA